MMEIGQKVKVREPGAGQISVIVRQRKGQTGVIRDFKMVDGSGVGFVVQFDDKFATWFFAEELEAVR